MNEDSREWCHPEWKLDVGWAIRLLHSRANLIRTRRKDINSQLSQRACFSLKQVIKHPPIDTCQILPFTDLRCKLETLVGDQDRFVVQSEPHFSGKVKCVVHDEETARDLLIIHDEFDNNFIVKLIDSSSANWRSSTSVQQLEFCPSNQALERLHRGKHSPLSSVRMGTNSTKHSHR